ncbi:hypothetical protein [Actinomadura mexicana]|uniref:Uncharacterized protein n=1 Tax=Actinomadura mexicana TaxID=134959 RepID=A0A238W6A4_9ACTN|nr:hypothetical protein [Actinomadura mexicana]SNR41713.1 hypothetical protein SAMN06265355_102728 [Actinomadura mexicana]
MIGNASHDRDELLVNGMAPVASLPAGPLAEPLPPEGAAATPVFVDATGWRARIGRRLGLLVGALLLVFLGALGLGMTTGADVPLTPWSEPSVQPRAKVARPSVPAGEAGERAPAARPRPTGPAARSPRASASPAAPVAPAAPAPAAPAPGASAAPPAATATGTATSAPGRSQATPPAWGRKKKSR